MPCSSVRTGNIVRIPVEKCLQRILFAFTLIVKTHCAYEALYSKQQTFDSFPLSPLHYRSFALGRSAAQMTAGLQPPTPHTFCQSDYLEVITALCSGVNIMTTVLALSMRVLFANLQHSCVWE